MLKSHVQGGMSEVRKGHSVLGPPQENHCACWSGLAAERQTMAASVPGRGSSNLGPSLVPGWFYSFLHSNREYHTVRPEAELGLRKFQVCLSLPYSSHQDSHLEILPALSPSTRGSSSLTRQLLWLCYGRRFRIPSRILMQGIFFWVHWVLCISTLTP